MNFKEVLLVVNPISGDSNKENIVNKTRQKVKDLDANFHLFATTGYEDIQKIHQRIQENNIDRILVAGGDGTINLVADAIKDLEISLGVIPAGSANGLAVNLQLPENIDDQLNIALGENFIDMDLVCLNDIICLHISDLGINAELIKNYEQSSIRGKMGYLIQSIPTLIKSNYPFQFSIQTKNGTKETEGVLLGIANAKKYGTGANVNPPGKVTDGKFEILLFKKFSISEILKTLRNETNFDPEVIEIFSTDEAVITCKKPVAFQIDGEYIGENTEVTVKILPQKLKIMVPENFTE